MASDAVQTAKPGGVPAAPGEETTVCPRFHAAVELIGRRWSGAIVFALLSGECYFRELGAAIPGVSDRLLSQRLRELEEAGLVEREVEPGPPTRVRYSLTVSGRELEPVIDELYGWAQRWAPAPAAGRPT